jgi:tyrosyl-tRNA synthetase
MPAVTTTPNAIDWLCTHAVERIYPSAEAFREKLRSGARLRVYYGIDPTGPTIHIGHTVPLRKMAELQAMGHEIIILIGDFTAMIGDPTDKTATRKQQTREQVLENCRLYREQIGHIIKFDGPNAAQMKFNNDWLGKMSFGEVLELASHFTVQQMMERDMFKKRAAEEKPIHVHEFMYPLMQGYDSVAMEVDVEVGGNDQTFNMLAGRTLLREMKGKEKFVIAAKLLADPTGKKMGKSEGNMIAFSDTPEDAYGKLMSWPDEMLLPSFEVLTDKKPEEILAIRSRLSAGENPMNVKRELALEIVSWIFGAEAGEHAAAQFTQVHSEGQVPDEMPELALSESSLSLIDLLVRGELVSSNSDARRQIEQGGVKVDGTVVTDVKTILSLGSEPMIIQKGKRHFLRVIKK